MDRIKLALCLLSLLVTCHIMAANSDSGAYTIVNQYTKENGLPVNAVTDLVIDKTGFLWVATHDGLLRFDGLSFTLFNTNSHPSMPSNQIRSIKGIDSGGLLVFFSSKNLYLFNGTRFSKIAEVTLDSFEIIENQLWYGTNQGLFVYDLTTHKARKVISETHITSLTFNDSGLFYADDKCTVYFYALRSQTPVKQAELNCQRVSQMKFNGDKLAVSTDVGAFVMGKEVKQYLLGKHILKVAWIDDHLYTLSAALHKINTHTGSTTELSRPNAMIIYLDPPAQIHNKQIWVNEFSRLRVDDEIAFKSPSSIFKHVIDQQGGLWVATKGDGLFYLRKPVIETLGLEEGQLTTGFVTGITKASKGHYLVSESTDLYRFNPKKNTWHKFNNITYMNTYLYDSSGNIWVSQNGLCKMDKQEVCHKQPYPVSKLADVQLLFEDSKRQIWVGSDEGLFVNADEQWQLVNTQNSHFVFAEEVPGQGVFLASSQHGISVFKKNKEVQLINTDYGFPTNKIRTLYFDPKFNPNALLIGTVDQGLCLWHFTEGFKRCAGIAEGLPHYGIHRILPDTKKRLWFSSNRGIYTISLKNLTAYFNFEINNLPNHRFGTRDGMADSEANGGVQTSGIIGYQGDLWFPTQKGVVRIPADHIDINEPALSVYIKSIHVGGALQNNTKTIVIENPEQRNLTVSLSSIALGLGDIIHFRYRIKKDETWIDLNKNREISFNALPPGRHSLEFQAARGGNWIGPITEVSVEVVPTLLETIWFRALLVFIVLISLFWWIQKLLKRKHLLEAEVQKRTTELSSALKTISDQKDRIKNVAKRKQQHFLELSHELRTPLTLILGPLHDKAPIKNETRTRMAQNADKLSHLIDQMLKLEQLDVFDKKVSLQPISVYSRCQIVLDQFKDQITQHNLNIDLHNPIKTFILKEIQKKLIRC